MIFVLVLGELTISLENVALAFGHTINPASVNLMPGAEETLPSAGN